MNQNLPVDVISVCSAEGEIRPLRLRMEDESRQMLRINIDEIVYIEGQKDYVRIYLDNGTKVMALLNMKTLEDTLPHPEFLRTHRSFIVNMSKVKNVVRFRIVIGDKLIPISDSYKDRVQQYLEERTLS